jgi:ArsR family transcriptional regulator
MPLPETIRILSAAAEPNRLRILAVLRGRRMCVCELCAALGLKQSVMSQHLRVLRDCGLVEDRKNGLWVDYEFSAAARRGHSGRMLAAILDEAAADEAVRRDRKAAAKADRRAIGRRAGR